MPTISGNEVRFRRPPYSRELEAILRDRARWPSLTGTSPNGRCLQLWVLAGTEAWHFAMQRGRHYAMLLAPPGVPPDSLDWSALAGHDPVCVLPCGRLTQIERRALATAILRDGARRVVFVDETLDRYIRVSREARDLTDAEACA